MPARPNKRTETTVSPHTALLSEVHPVFPAPVQGAPAQPVAAPSGLFGLRRGLCVRQSTCLDRAVRAGWSSFSCEQCAGYVEEIYDPKHRRGGGFEQ